MKVRASLVGVAIFFYGISFLTIVEGMRIKSYLSVTDFRIPLRPDIYLQSLGWFMAFITTLFLVKDIFYAKVQTTATRSGTNKHDVIITLLMFSIYIISIEWLGYILSSFMFFFAFLRWIGKYSYFKTLIVSIPAAVCLYLIFVKGFEMILPIGIIESTLLGG